MYLNPTTDIPIQFLQLLLHLLQLQVLLLLLGRPHGDRRLDRPDQHLLLVVDIPPPPAGIERESFALCSGGTARKRTQGVRGSLLGPPTPPKSGFHAVAGGGYL